jgi:galactitol-specific phosphotransferase system IIC component
MDFDTFATAIENAAIVLTFAMTARAGMARLLFLAVIGFDIFLWCATQFITQPCRLAPKSDRVSCVLGEFSRATIHETESCCPCR